MYKNKKLNSDCNLNCKSHHEEKGVLFKGKFISYDLIREIKENY